MSEKFRTRQLWLRRDLRVASLNREVVLSGGDLGNVRVAVHCHEISGVASEHEIFTRATARLFNRSVKKNFYVQALIERRCPRPVERGLELLPRRIKIGRASCRERV